MPLPETFTISSGNITTQIPAIGFGTFQPDPTTPPGTAKAAVLEALKCGYRHIDTAYAYSTGKVEKEVGEAIRECGLKREELFIVTKLYAHISRLEVWQFTLRILILSQA